MKFPVRSESHKIESASWRLLQEVAPDNWIIREVSERDYGIDAYVEMCKENGEVTGDLISLQLKGVKRLKWDKKKDKDWYVSKSPYIKPSTLAYWFNLPVPVFLLVADISERKIYFSAVKNEMRSSFDKIDKNMRFGLIKDFEVGSVIGDVFIEFLSRREYFHRNFVIHITNLLSSISSYTDFIDSNRGRDSFMEVEFDRHIQFRSLYQTCRMASLSLTGEWKVDSLRDLYKMDRDAWKDDFIYLHEHTLDYALGKIEEIFPKLVRSAYELVTKKQSAYWKSRDHMFFRLCSDGELMRQIEHLASVSER